MFSGVGIQSASPYIEPVDEKNIFYISFLAASKTLEVTIVF